MNTNQRTIHQIWFQGQTIPEKYSTFVESWKKLNPTWKYKLWDGPTMDALITRLDPDFLPVWNSFEHWVYKVDAIRYYILYSEGGLYVDTDFLALKPMSEILDQFTEDILLGDECDYNKQFTTYSVATNNSWLYSAKPNLSFWSHVIKTMKESVQRADPNWDQFNKVFRTVGPLMLTSAFHSWSLKQEIGVLPSKLLFPIEPNLFQPGFEDQLAEQLAEQHKSGFAIHFYSISWVGDMISKGLLPPDVSKLLSKLASENKH